MGLSSSYKDKSAEDDLWAFCLELLDSMSYMFFLSKEYTVLAVIRPVSIKIPSCSSDCVYMEADQNWIKWIQTCNENIFFFYQSLCEQFFFIYVQMHPPEDNISSSIKSVIRHFNSLQHITDAKHLACSKESDGFPYKSVPAHSGLYFNIVLFE